MATIRHNKPSSITIAYVGGQERFLTLGPGVNLGVDDDEWEAAKQHPIVKTLLENGTLEPLSKAPVITSELEGFEVVDHPKTDEPTPIIAAKTVPAPDKQPRRSRSKATEPAEDDTDAD